MNMQSRQIVDDTIVQLSTPRIISAIHIIRFSGSRSKPFFLTYTNLAKPRPRQVYSTLLYSEDKKGKDYPRKAIDYVLGFFFIAPYSFTGEDMLELHVHGSLLIVDEILALAVKFGCRLASPGEFTYRAFLNGKIRLHQAEAIDALIQSASEPQKQNALRILEGRAGFTFSELKEKIVSMLAELESAIEYPEEDIPLVTEDKKTLYAKYLKQLEEIRNYFLTVFRNYQIGKKLAEGFKVMIIGFPNSGKSTLFNLLVGEDRAIVSATQGTTRDYIIENITIPLHKDNPDIIPNTEENFAELGNKFELQLYDTAGIHDYPEAIESEGIDKVMELVPEMDLLIWLVADEESYFGFKASKIGNAIIERYLGKEKAFREKIWVILGKADKLDVNEKNTLLQKITTDFGEVVRKVVSLKENLTKLKEELYMLLRNWILETYHYDKNSVALLNKRQALSVSSILVATENIKAKLIQYDHEEIIVTEFRNLEYLFKELSMDTGLEEVYDALFSKFCIGK